MCDNCDTLARHGQRLSDMHHGLVKVIRRMAADPTTPDLAGLPALSATFGALALSAHPAREASALAAFFRSLDPHEIKGVRDLCAALAMLYGGGAVCANTALEAVGSPDAWQGDDHPPTTFDGIVHHLTEREEEEEEVQTGEIVLGFPEAPPPGMEAKVKAILAEAARKIADLTGAPVDMQELHHTSKGFKPGNRSTTAPGQLPVIVPAGAKKIVH